MQHMAAHGWVCVAINYRLSPRDAFPAHLVDVKRAIAWIREHIAEYGGDPDVHRDHRRLGRRPPHGAGRAHPERPGVPARLRGRRHHGAGRVPFYGVYDFAGRDRHAQGAADARRVPRPAHPQEGPAQGDRGVREGLAAAARGRRGAAVLRDPRPPRHARRGRHRRGSSSRRCAPSPSSQSPTPSCPAPSTRSMSSPRSGAPTWCAASTGSCGSPMTAGRTRAQPRGRPRIRSAATLRSTCVVPPAMLRQRVVRASCQASCAVASPSTARSPKISSASSEES